jgi:hypothetical protein
MKKALLYTCVCSILLCGCAMFPGKSRAIRGEEKKYVLSYAIPAIELLLKGFAEEKYEDYSKYFDESTKNALTEAVFKQTRGMIISKIGTYRTYKINKVLKENQYKNIFLRAVFDNDDSVIIKVSFQRYPEGNLISGLWISSAKLRK